MEYQHSLSLENYSPYFSKIFENIDSAFRDSTCFVLKVTGCPSVGLLQDSFNLILHEYPELAKEITFYGDKARGKKRKPSVEDLTLVVDGEPTLSIDIIEKDDAVDPQTLIDQSLALPFELAKPLLRLTYYANKLGDDYLVICAHSLCLDRHSIYAFIGKLSANYNTLLNSDDAKKCLALQKKNTTPITPFSSKDLLDGLSDNGKYSELPSTERDKFEELYKIKKKIGRSLSIRLQAWCIDNSMDIGRVLTTSWQSILSDSYERPIILIASKKINESGSIRTSPAQKIVVASPSLRKLIPSIEQSGMNFDDSSSYHEMPADQLFDKYKSNKSYCVYPADSFIDYLETPTVGFKYPDGSRFYIEAVDVCHFQAGSSESIYLDLTRREGGIEAQLMYVKSVNSSSKVDSLWKHYCESLEELVDTYGDATRDARFSENELFVMFERAVDLNKNKVAVIDQQFEVPQKKYTFLEINKAANRVAHTLIKKGISEGDKVGVYSSRTYQSFVALLAVWKAGAVYLPLDIVQPTDTLSNIIEQSRPKYLLTSKSCAGKLAGVGAEALTLDDLIQEDTLTNTQNPNRTYSAERPSLLLFTSGSTGTPKGVVHKQQQLINRFRWLWRNYSFSDTDIACQRTNLGYQPSLWEMLGGLLSGIPTVVLGDEIVKDPYLMESAIIEHGITHLTLVPSLLQLLLNGEKKSTSLWKNVRSCITAGEPLKPNLYHRFTEEAENTVLLNDYGSTEVNGVLYFDNRDTKTKSNVLPGFRTIDNVDAYILDADLHEVEAGQIGTLHIAGVSLAQEYLGNVALTNEKFIMHPEIGCRMYCMGDLARRDQDGFIEILGRADNQLKIRGNRVELEGIENALQNCRDVLECAVGVKNMANGAKSLVAFIVTSQNTNIDTIRHDAEKKLPNYMLPSFFRKVESVPRSPNGKVDRTILNKIANNFTEENSQRESTSTPLTLLDRLISISAAILEIEKKDINPSKKFYEIGFDSSNIVALSETVTSQMGLEVRVSDLYEIACIEGLALHLKDLLAVEDGDMSIGSSSSEFVNNGVEKRKEFLLELLKREAARLLDIPETSLDSKRKFYELGFDSGIAAEYIKKINNSEKIELRIKDLYSNPTLDELSSYICQTFSLDYTNSKSSNAAQENTDRQAIVGDKGDKGDKGDNSKVLNDIEPIAIIGVSGSYAEFDDLAEYWDGLCEGRSSIREVPENRWQAEHYFSDDISESGSIVSKWGGFLNNIEGFDADFFGIMPTEALFMDPQQRICLQESWRTFENAGYSEESISGSSTGVFVGHRTGDYSERTQHSESHPTAMSLMGNDSAVLSARIAYHFNLKGPSVSLDTACSSSLVAIHLACQSVRAGDCNMALAGGVNILTMPTLYQQSTKMGMLTPDGRCKSFDNRADGFVPGEGVGFVLIKPLRNALQDGDNVHAVILGSGINQDGRTNGITAPNAQSQQALIEKVCREYNIDPHTIGFIETHGTGTKLGDPIEFEALSGAYSSFNSSRVDQCVLGAVKTNIGHTIAAAGIAGLHKTILSIQNKSIPPTINFDQINEHIDISASPFVINTELVNWDVALETKRRASVSSFGFSGTNAYLVIEEAPKVRLETTSERNLFLVPLSAKSEKSLTEKENALAEFLLSNSDVRLSDIELTCFVGRSHYKHRRLLVATDIASLVSNLQYKEYLDHETLEKNARDLSDGLMEKARQYLNGKQIVWNKEDLKNLFNGSQKIALPGYSFDTKRFWLEYSPHEIQSVERYCQIEPAGKDDKSDLALINAVEESVREVICEVTGFGLDELKPDDSFEKIGISSVLVLSLNREMKDRFGSLPDTIFYENQSIRQISDCLCSRFEEQAKTAIGWKANSDSEDRVSNPKSVPSESWAVPQRSKKDVGHRINLGDTSADSKSCDIAIVGLSGRYPNADTVEQFWSNLREAKDCITEIPSSRWNAEEMYSEKGVEPGEVNSKWGGFLDDIECFDPLFFNISPKDAELQDPQERLFLQTAWHAFEDAGYSKKSLANFDVGVYVGVVWSEYQLFGIEEKYKGNLIFPNSSFSSIANRVSYSLDLSGPSIAVDTMCSSSLTAIHLACQSISSGECDMAVAGGVNLSLHPTKYQLLARGRFLSSDGHCRSFGEGGDGYVPGEGVGAVVLKSLSSAVAAGDHIYGVIKGSAINHGGKTSGYTVPNPNAQGTLIKEALKRAHVDPSSIDYIEAHGTGTELGDPIEIAGLMQAFESVDPGNCAIGSVKSNIGHLEAAAGIAGLTKILLQMKNRLLVPSILEGVTNTKIPFETTPFSVQTKTETWLPKRDRPRRAALSAFGAGGSNSHMIIEAYDEIEKSPEDEKGVTESEKNREGEQIIVLSARQEHTLKEQAKKLSEYLKLIREPEWTPARISNVVSKIIGQVLNVEYSQIDLKDALIDYVNDETDVKQIVYLLNDRLPSKLRLDSLDTSTPIAELISHLPKSSESQKHRQEKSNYSLANIAYTLQQGREHFEFRTSFVVSSTYELIQQLEIYCEGKSSKHVVSGNISNTGYDLNELFSQSAGQQFIGQLVAQKSLRQIAQMWVAGAEINWSLFHSDSTPRRLSLPGYPFDKTPYWFKTNGSETKEGLTLVSSMLHPLVHANCSTLLEQKFEAVYNVTDFYFDHHRVNSRATLPGVAYIEIMLAALNLSTVEDTYTIKNVMFLQPLVIDESEVHGSVVVKIDPDRKDGIEIRVESEDGLVYSKSKAVKKWEQYSQKSKILTSDGQDDVVTTISRESVYDICESVGMRYGDSFRVLDSVKVGKSKAIGTIQLNSEYVDSEFRLHPSIMDGGLQTLLVLMSQMPDIQDKKYLPFSVDKIEVLSPPGHFCTAIVKTRNASINNPSFDIHYIDEYKNTLVSIMGLTLREVERKEKEEILYYSRVWDASPLEPKNNSDIVPSAILVIPSWTSAEQCVDICRHTEGLKSTKLYIVRDSQSKSDRSEGSFDIDLQSESDIERLFSSLDEIPSNIVSLIGFNDPTDSLSVRPILSSLLLVKAISKLNKTHSGFQLLSIFSENIDNLSPATLPTHQALGGLYKTAKIESPNIQGRSVEIAKQDVSLSEALRIASAELRFGKEYESEVRYTDQGRAVNKLIESEGLANENEKFPEKGGRKVVLIAGGLGKLGLVSASWVFSNNPSAVVILCGRSPADSEAQNQITHWKEAGRNVVVSLFDITDAQRTNEAIIDIQKDHGVLTGVVNCAGTINDAYLINKSIDDFLKVIAPKVTGTANLDEATKDIALDYFILFSSIAGVLGNPGQSDYVYANSYLDSFAESRNKLIASGLRSGFTVSINWPLWADGGMTMDSQTQRRLKDTWGVVPIPKTLGIEELSRALRQNRPNHIVVYGTARLLRESMHINSEQASYGRSNSKTPDVQNNDARHRKTYIVENGTGTDDVFAESKAYVTGLISSATKVPKEQLDDQAHFDRYGIDSVVIADLNTALEEKFKGLPQTLLFEYQTISDLARFLAEQYTDEFSDVDNQIADGTSKSDRMYHSVEKELGNKEGEESIRHRFILNDTKSNTSTDIAIIGMSGRYPQANNLDRYWENLQNGISSIVEIPVDRWNSNEFFRGESTSEPGSNSRWGGFIDDVDKFDPLFFNISPAEAELMDPQERICIELVWQVLEDAGYTRDTLNASHEKDLDGSTGLFVGCMYKHYPWLARNAEAGPFLSISSYWNITNRVSYLFDFQGPSIAVDTACASSLTAVHMACEHIRQGICTTAVAGGVNLTLHPDKFIGLSESGMLSSESISRGLGRGDGYVSGEGAGMILLKPLSLAEADDDHIYAVIKGGAINHGGKSNSFATPNPKAQAAVAKQALKSSGLTASKISYLETAANGAELGDMIEFNALNTVYREAGEKSKRCAIGTVKSNIGHLEAASGISQLSKVVLQLKNKVIVPTINSTPLNSKISLDESPFYIVTEASPWNVSQDNQRRYAAVNSIGAGGANAHVIIAEYEQKECKNEDSENILDSDKNIFPVLLSARSIEGVSKLANQLADHLEHRSLGIADVSYTLAIGRESHDIRLVVCTKSIEELIPRLREISDQLSSTGSIDNSLNDSEYALSGPSNVNALAGYDGLFAKDVSKWLKLEVVNWRQVWEGRSAKRVSLPTYPFERNSYWIPGFKYGSMSLVSSLSVDKAKHENQGDINDRDCRNVALMGSRNIEQCGDEHSQLSIYITREVVELLKVDPEVLNTSDDLKLFGFDSLQATKLLNRLQPSFAKRFVTSELVEVTTIDGFVDYLIDNEYVAEQVTSTLDNQTEESIREWPDETAIDSKLIEILDKLENGDISLDKAIHEEKLIQQKNYESEL